MTTPDHLSPSPSPSSSVPSFVRQIDLEAVGSLATAVRYRTTSLLVSCTVGPTPKLGAFNVVWFIDFTDEVHWAFRTPIADWIPSLEKRLRSDIASMQFIQTRTKIPIPHIHDFSVTTENAIGRPYIIMERVKGTQLCKRWFDPSWFTEERRRTVFRSIISSMCQLKEFEFPAIGSLEYDLNTDSHSVGPLLPSFEDLAEGDYTEAGPYYTVHAYLQDDISRQMSSGSTKDEKVSLSLLRLFAGSLPDDTLDRPPFVLSMPDFNYQNIFVDEDGNVTGLIDWDGMIVGPRQSGYARYPGWITRDWDPLMHRWPEEEEAAGGSQDEGEGRVGDGDGGGDGKDLDVDDPSTSCSPLDPHRHPPTREELEEDSPATLHAFREEYLSIFAEMDPTSALYTRQSHILEALEIAIGSPYCRGHILDRLSKYVFGTNEFGERISCWSLEEGIGEGEWVKEVNIMSPIQ